MPQIFTHLKWRRHIVVLIGLPGSHERSRLIKMEETIIHKSIASDLHWVLLTVYWLTQLVESLSCFDHPLTVSAWFWNQHLQTTQIYMKIIMVPAPMSYSGTLISQYLFLTLIPSKQIINCSIGWIDPSCARINHNYMHVKITILTMDTFNLRYFGVLWKRIITVIWKWFFFWQIKESSNSENLNPLSVSTWKSICGLKTKIIFYDIISHIDKQCIEIQITSYMYLHVL